MNTSQNILLTCLIFFFTSKVQAQLTFTLPATVCPNQVYTVTATHDTTSAYGYTWSSSNSANVAISHTSQPTTLMLFFGAGNVYTISVIANLSTGTTMATQVVT